MKRKTKITAILLTLALFLTAIVPAPIPVEAAKKAKLEVNLKNTTILHQNEPNGIATGLKVKYKGKNVTAKAKYTVTNKKVAKVIKNKKYNSAMLAAGVNGKTTLTIKYAGKTKKIKINITNHKWKEHKTTGKAQGLHLFCPICGKDLSKLVKNYNQFCNVCQEPRQMCVCNLIKHADSHYLSGELSSGEIFKAEPRIVEKKVTYTDYCYCDCGSKQQKKIPYHCKYCKYLRFR